MPAKQIREWRLSFDGTRMSRGPNGKQPYDIVVYRHESLPLEAMAYERSDGSWEALVRTTNKRSENTIGDGVYPGRREAVRAVERWARRHPHPARLVTEDREFAKDQAERFGGGGMGDVFDSLF